MASLLESTVNDIPNERISAKRRLKASYMWPFLESAQGSLLSSVPGRDPAQRPPMSSRFRRWTFAILRSNSSRSLCRKALERTLFHFPVDEEQTEEDVTASWLSVCEDHDEHPTCKLQTTSFRLSTIQQMLRKSSPSTIYLPLIVQEGYLSLLNYTRTLLLHEQYEKQVHSHQDNSFEWNSERIEEISTMRILEKSS